MFNKKLNNMANTGPFQDTIKESEQHKINIDNKTKRMLKILIDKTISKKIVWGSIRTTRIAGNHYYRISRLDNGISIEEEVFAGSKTYRIFFDGEKIYGKRFECENKEDEVLESFNKLWDYIYQIQALPNIKKRYQNDENMVNEALKKIEEYVQNV